MKEIIIALITACGGGLIAGIFTLISSGRQAKKDKKEEEKEILNKIDDLDKKVDKINEKLDGHIAKDEMCKADEARIRILRFGDDVRAGYKYTEEHWSNILMYIDRYEKYCDTHSGYENNRAVHTIQYLKDVYDESLKNNNFL